jgi:hypothetical protein
MKMFYYVLFENAMYTVTAPSQNPKQTYYTQSRMQTIVSVHHCTSVSVGYHLNRNVYHTNCVDLMQRLTCTLVSARYCFMRMINNPYQYDYMTACIASRWITMIIMSTYVYE